MEKQALLRKFLIDLGAFLESYYSSNISDVKYHTDEKSMCMTIIGYNNLDSLKISTENDEITLLYKYSHWHIDDYNNPISFENIYEQTINSIFSVINSELLTYEVFYNDKDLGGGNLIGNVDNIIIDCKKTFKNANIIKINKWNEEEKIINI